MTKKGVVIAAYRLFISRLWYFLLPLLALVTYFFVSTQLGVNHAPDEHMRLQVPFYIYTHNSLPIGNEPEIINRIWGYSYAFTAYGPSMLAAVFMKIASVFSTNLSVLIVAARFTNVVTGALTVFVSMRIARRLFTHHFAPIVMGVFVGFTPQFVFLSSYLNNDAPSALSVAIIVLAWIQGIQDGWDVRSSALLGFGLGACAVTYYFGYAFILASIVVFFFTLARQHIDAEDRIKYGAKLVGVIFLIAFVTGGWYFIRNGIIYHGDILGMSTRDVVAEQFAEPGFKPSDHTTPRREGLSVVDMVFEPYVANQIWWKNTLKSSIGLFGYMNAPLPSKLYVAYTLSALFLVFLGIMYFKKLNISYSRLFTIVFLSSSVFVLALSIYYSWTTGYQAQGRYLYSAYVPFMIYMTNGVVIVANLIERIVEPDTATDASNAEENVTKKPVSSLVVGVTAVCYLVAFILSTYYGLGVCMTGDVFPDALPPLLNGS